MLIFDKSKELKVLEEAINIALDRTEYNFKFNKNKYYSKDGQVYFNPYQTYQYAVFLNYLSNSIWKKFNNESLSTIVYCLNKLLNSFDLYFEVELPDIFSLSHPVGTVMGRAKYSDFFSISQNCTVGNNHGIFPTFEKNVILFSGVTVIGNCKIGENCLISANTYIKDTDIPENSIVFGSSPNLIIKEKTKEYMEKYFQSKWTTS
ncbi:transferase [Bacillus sp. X1(2014)]|uniref:transferase n=1 Tax=Bacillus sp. X1(2014) TaxID=1565991 RepID=UPI001C9308F2|nr:transferase [Bacillus sp. X1(2014)]